MSQLTRSLVLACCVAWSTGAGAAATIQGVGDLPGGAYESFVNGVSADGGTVFGYGTGDDGISLGDAFRWTEEFGIEALGWDPQGTSAVGASLYGQYVAVTSGTQFVEWFLWTAPLGLERITHGEAVGISDDASVVASNDTRGALRWTAATGSVVLDPFLSDTQTLAEGVSGNGAFVVGVSYGTYQDVPAYHAVRWDASGVPLHLGNLPSSEAYAWAYAVSADGSVVVGSSSTDEPGGAFRWTETGGMQNLGVLPGGEAGGSSAHAVSPDGAVVLGQSFSPQGYQPVVWDAHHGMRGLASALANDYGLDVGALGWSLFNVTGISADRRTIVGTGQRNIAEPPGLAIAYEGYVVRLDTPLPEPGAASVSGVACIALFALRRRRRRGVAIASILLAATLVSGAARAQVAGTDCGCTLMGAYVSPDAGVRPDGATISPGGVFRVEGGTLPGPITVVRQSNGAQMLQVQASDWGWSPDGDRIVILSVTGAPPNTSRQYLLYDLASGPTSTPVWSSPASTLWSSERLRFSEDGAVLLFAALSEVNNDQVELAAVEIATGATLTDTFSFYSPPSSFDDDSDPEVAGWGFGPDPTRIAYGYTTGQGNYTRVLGNVATGAKRGLQYTANDEIPFFSPCGDVFAEKVRQLATSDDVTVTLYATADPQASSIANRGFANGVAVEVRANLSDHVGLLGGVEHPIASNVADDACAPENQPPSASFTPPTDPVIGQAATFTDTSSDADGTIVAWSWDFGDGATSSARNPSHAFAAAGAYSVTLTVTDDDGATDTSTREVRVCDGLDDAAGALLYTIDAGLQGDVFNRDVFAYDVASGASAQLTDSDWDLAVGDGYVQFGGSGTGAGARRSPDGMRIAFAPYAFGEAGIWVMDADGGDRRRLTDGDGSNGDFDLHHNPAWSPDGEWIAFENGDFFPGADATGLYMVRADGTGLVKIPGTSRFNPIADKSPDFFPEIAPACAATPPAQRGPGCYRIAFVRNLFTQPFTDTVRSVRGDGSDPQVLVSEPGSYHSVRVAPDGARLAITREYYNPPNGDAGIYVLDLVAGASQQRVTDTNLLASFPVWSPDGRFLAYSARPIGQADTDLFVTDSIGCGARAVRAAPSVQERPEDWRPGSVAQTPIHFAGYVTGGNWLQRYGGVTLALSGDADATAVSAPDGSFSFENLPAGGVFFLSIVSAPPGLIFDPRPVPITLGGNAVGATVMVYPDEATIYGSVLFEGALLEGMVIRADGPGGPFEATTDANGRYSLTTRRDQTYTISGHKPGYRLDPETRSVWVGTQLLLDLDAVAVQELPPGRIAFTRSIGGDDEIYALDLETAVATNLSNWPDASDRDPSWSPDGARLAFTSTRDGYSELFLMDADGSNASATGVEGYEPAWSPDGGWIAYASGWGISVYRIATGESFPLTYDASDRHPAWGTAEWPGIVFERDGAQGRDLFGVNVSLDFLPPIGFEYSVIERDGDDLEVDLVPGNGETGFALSTQDGDASGTLGVNASFPFQYAQRRTPGRNPSWSPDARFVAYDDGAGSLWLFEPGSGGAPIAITDTGAIGSAADSDPDWRPASRAQAACDDGLDDDGDGLVDMDDPGCPFPYASPENPPCDNGVDDDGNGLTDFDDPNCSREWPYWENPPACGLGGELLLGIAAWGAFRRRGARRR